MRPIITRLEKFAQKAISKIIPIAQSNAFRRETVAPFTPEGVTLNSFKLLFLRRIPIAFTPEHLLRTILAKDVSAEVFVYDKVAE